MQDARPFPASAHPLVPRAGREGTVTEPGAQPWAAQPGTHREDGAGAAGLPRGAGLRDLRVDAPQDPSGCVASRGQGGGEPPTTTMPWLQFPPGAQQLQGFAPVAPNLDQLCEPWFK